MTATQRLVISGGTVVDQQGERRADVAVVEGRIVEVGTGLVGDTMLDATGCMVSPGFVDLHTHLREPGKEEAETIETGSRAAALGGFTAVVAMPNTDPAQDSVAVVEFVREQGRRAGLCEVLPSGCITVGRAGERLAPFGELTAAGVHLFTDDGNGVQDPLLMRRALEYAGPLGITLRHVLPNIASVLIVQATIQFAVAILAEAGLSYLGLGAQPPVPSWGRMLRDAQTYIFQAPELAVWPGLAIALAVLGLNMLGDGLRDLLDPRLRLMRVG